MAEENRPPEEETTEETPVEEAPVEETPTAEETPAEEPTAAAEAEEAAEEAAPRWPRRLRRPKRLRLRKPLRPRRPAPTAEADESDDEDEEAPAPREKPLIPGADLEVDIVREGEAALRGESRATTRTTRTARAATAPTSVETAQPIAVEIDLAAGARYRATGKRKTSVARVTLKPGTGAYVINGRTLEQHFPRFTLQRNIRQPLETVGYEDRMDVVANLHGGGVSAQAGALRHGVSRALLEADPNLRSELKRRGFLTRDPRVKERKKAGLKKARKRPQFSKR